MAGHGQADLPARRGRRARRQADGRGRRARRCRLSLRRPSRLQPAERQARRAGDRLPVLAQDRRGVPRRAAHAAMGPHEGRNALLAAAAAALGLHGIARHAEEQTHVNVGKLVAGIGRNIIADRAEMMIEVRGGSQATLDYMTERAMQVLAGRRHDAGRDVRDQAAGRDYRRRAERGCRAHRRSGRRHGRGHRGSPARMVDRRRRRRDLHAAPRAAARRRGRVLHPRQRYSPPVHHATDFDIDEAALDHGVRLFTGIADRVLGASA